MPTRRKLMLFVSAGFIVVVLATLLDTLTTPWRGLLVFSGGWLMAIGVLYQVKLYAQQTDSPYSVILVFAAGVIWLCMTAATLFWLNTLFDFI